MARVGIFPAFLVSFPLWVGGLSAQTEAQNAAAFNGGAGITNQSYHWDSLGGDPMEPQVATTPRTVLEGASLTTLSWDPGLPGLYQEKTIGSVTYQTTLVATFTQPYGIWDSTPGTELTLTYDDGGTTAYIMPWVTSGNHLRDYLQDNYFPSGADPDSSEVALRVQQSLGLPQSDATGHGLAFFWVPLDHLSRPAYSGDISSQLGSLDTFADGSYQPTEVDAPEDFTYVDLNDPTKTYTGEVGLEEFVEWNQAETTYPWTAMGWTYNWNALQDGSNAAFGFDPMHPETPVALSEFVVSGGSQVLAEDWVPFSELGEWVLIPEPGTFWVPWCIAVAVVFGSRRRQARPSSANFL